MEFAYIKIKYKHSCFYTFFLYFQLVNMLHMKPITYNIKNMLISNMYSQNQNVQYHRVQITNILLKGYPFSCTLDQFKSRIYGCKVSC